MSPPRTKCRPTLELPFWQIKGKLYFADRTAIEDQIKKVGRTQDEIKRRMGFGYSHLQNLLDGKGIDMWAAAHVETGIKEDRKVESSNYDWNELVKEFPGVDLPPNKYEEGPF